MKKNKNIYLKSSLSTHKERTEHEKAVDGYIPEAVRIANQKIKRDIEKEPALMGNDPKRNKRLSLYFLEAMDELTHKAGLRVLQG